LENLELENLELERLGLRASDALRAPTDSLGSMNRAECINVRGCVKNTVQLSDAN